MINLSWGKRIAILYIGFVVLIGVMITFSMKQKIELVSADYYDKELVFQGKIDEMNNANALSEKVEHSFFNDSFLIQFPSEFKDKKVKGEIVFFRPSDASKDFKKEIELDEKLLEKIDLSKFTKGMYKMQISWNANSIKYFTEETIVIP
ncbi:hypothetical protein BH10BAC1_BH10BAC1_18650 [soil metagenome]